MLLIIKKNKHTLQKMYFAINYLKVMQENQYVMILEGLIVSEGSNRNGTYFSLDAINNAFPTIANIPIICIYDGFDFKEHARNSYEEKNVQRIGVVPESNQGEIVNIDNKNWQKINLIIWKSYSSGLVETILQHNNKNGFTKISMEIDILQSHKRPDGLLEIDKYVYCAICLLGEKYTEAIPGANVNVLKFTKQEHNEDIKKLNMMYFSLINNNERKGVYILKDLMSALKSKFAEAKNTFSNFGCDKKYVYAEIDGKKYKYEYSVDEDKKEYSINFSTEEEVYAEDTKTDTKEDEKQNKDDGKFSISEFTAVVTENGKLKAEITELKNTIETYAKKEITEKAEKLYADNKEFLSEDEIINLNKMLFSVEFTQFENEVNKIIVPKIRAKLNTSKDNTTPNVDFYSFSEKNSDNTKNTTISAFIKGGN